MNFFDYIDSVPTAAAIAGLVIGLVLIQGWKFVAWRANRRRV